MQRGIKMVAATSSVHECDNHSQALLDEVVHLFTDLLVASGASLPMIGVAMQASVRGNTQQQDKTRFTVLGSLLRDCMEVMCAWRRDVDFTDSHGEPIALQMSSSHPSFETLCRNAGCRRPAAAILRALTDFGAVSIDDKGNIRSETPTFLFGRASSGGRLATDALLKHVQGFMQCIHRNVRSVSGEGKPRFERACTVTVAAELEPIFDQLVRRRGQEFIDALDEWLERHARIESPSGRYVELGVGAYNIDFGERPGPKLMYRGSNST
jgi:hypothetical protein